MTTPFQTATQTTTNLPSATINSTIAAIAPVHSFVPPSTPPIELKDASIEMLDPERKANYFSDSPTKRQEVTIGRRLNSRQCHLIRYWMGLYRTVRIGANVEPFGC